MPGSLARACRAVRPGGPRDAVAGLTPPWVASPADTAEASALLAAATEHGLAVVPRGSGTSVSWGVPPSRLDLVIDTLRLDQVLEHAAGDLVVRAQAGVTMRQLAGVLATARQQLALDVPPGTGGGQDGSPTVGGLLATGSAGPRRLRYGTPRDLLIGITVIRPDGTVTKSGGKVVKNVAGYDLGKLYAGSLGTLGLITEAIFRLHPLPAAAAFVTAGYADTAAAAQGVAAAAGSELAPVAIEIDRPARDGLIRVAVLLEGDPAGVSERASLMRGVLGAGTATLDAAPSWWGAGPGARGPGPAGRAGWHGDPDRLLGRGPARRAARGGRRRPVSRAGPGPGRLGRRGRAARRRARQRRAGGRRRVPGRAARPPRPGPGTGLRGRGRAPGPGQRRRGSRPRPRCRTWWTCGARCPRSA